MPEYLLKAGDIVFGRKGAVERSAQVQLDEDGYFLGSDGIRIRLNDKECDPKFISYQLQTTAHRNWMIQHAAGSTMPSLNEGIIRRIPIVLKPLSEQKAIAAVLGALDDKIELNRRMNATLEAMARALFQSWFVDFDPVRAKLDGREPVGLVTSDAALFPEQLEDSPLGYIPKGWIAGTLSDGFNLTMGQSPPGYTYNEEGKGLPFYQGRTDFGFRFPSRRIYCTAPTRYAKPGDTLVSVRAPVGDINMAIEHCCLGRGVAAVRHRTGAISFTYYSMANLAADFSRFEADGTVFGSINKDSFGKLRFVIPPDEVVDAYEENVSPLDNKIRIHEEQSSTLAAIRDTMLPKLMNGELSTAMVARLSSPAVHQ
jgi:type I restriction enzyme S subunit